MASVIKETIALASRNPGLNVRGTAGAGQNLEIYGGRGVLVCACEFVTLKVRVQLPPITPNTP